MSRSTNDTNPVPAAEPFDWAGMVASSERSSAKLRRPDSTPTPTFLQIVQTILGLLALLAVVWFVSTARDLKERQREETQRWLTRGWQNKSVDDSDKPATWSGGGKNR